MESKFVKIYQFNCDTEEMSLLAEQDLAQEPVFRYTTNWNIVANPKIHLALAVEPAMMVCFRYLVLSDERLIQYICTKPSSPPTFYYLPVKSMSELSVTLLGSKNKGFEIEKYISGCEVYDDKHPDCLWYHHQENRCIQLGPFDQKLKRKAVDDDIQPQTKKSCQVSEDSNEVVGKFGADSEAPAFTDEDNDDDWEFHYLSFEDYQKYLQLVDNHLGKTLDGKKKKTSDGDGMVVRNLPSNVTPAHVERLNVVPKEMYDVQFSLPADFDIAFKNYLKFCNEKSRQLDDSDYQPRPINELVPSYDMVKEFFAKFTSGRLNQHPFASVPLRKMMTGGKKNFEILSREISNELELPFYLDLDMSCVFNIVFFSLMNAMLVGEAAQMKVLNFDANTRHRMTTTKLKVDGMPIKARDIEFVMEQANMSFNPEESAYHHQITVNCNMKWIPSNHSMKEILQLYNDFFNGRMYNNIGEVYQAMISENPDISLIKSLCCFYETGALDLIRSRMGRTAYFIIRDMYRCLAHKHADEFDPLTSEKPTIFFHWQTYQSLFNVMVNEPMINRFENCSNFDYYMRKQCDQSSEIFDNNVFKHVLAWDNDSRWNPIVVAMKYPGILFSYFNDNIKNTLNKFFGDRLSYEDEVKYLKNLKLKLADKPEEFDLIYSTFHFYSFIQLVEDYGAGNYEQQQIVLPCAPEHQEFIFEIVNQLLKIQNIESKVDQLIKKQPHAKFCNKLLDNYKIMHCIPDLVSKNVDSSYKPAKLNKKK